jgi:hypothetical protein
MNTTTKMVLSHKNKRWDRQQKCSLSQNKWWDQQQKCSLSENKWWDRWCLNPNNLNCWAIFLLKANMAELKFSRQNPPSLQMQSTATCLWCPTYMLPWKTEHTFGGPNVLGTLFPIHKNTTSTLKHWTQKNFLAKVAHEIPIFPYHSPDLWSIIAAL